MVLFVLCLVVIDVVILGVYTLTEGLRGNLGVRLTTNRELPEESVGVSTCSGKEAFSCHKHSCNTSVHSTDLQVLPLCL